jgi:hypothetical protein
VIAPLDESIVHTLDGEAEYVTDPVPAEAVPTADGGTSASVYEAL